MKLKTKIAKWRKDKSRIIVGNLNTSFSKTDRTTRQKISKE